MHIYHYTKYRLKDKILENGLSYDRRRTREDYGTRVINSIIIQYRPKSLPSFINRDKCVFFFIERNEDNFGFEVDTDLLDQNRLFIFDHDTVQRLYDLHIGHRTVEECRGGEFERLAKLYWKSATPFIESGQKDQGLWNKEILYFNQVPAYLLKIISDEPIEFINIIDKVSNHFDVRRLGYNEFEVSLNGNRKCTCNYINSKRTMQVDFDYDIDKQISKFLKRIIEEEFVRYQGLIIRFDGIYKISDNGETIEGKWEAFK